MKLHHIFFNQFINLQIRAINRKVYKKMSNLISDNIDRDYIIHILTCHTHIQYLQVCLYSFLKHLKSFPEIIIHNDGTLTKEDKDIIINIPNTHIIDPSFLKLQNENLFNKNKKLVKYREMCTLNKKIIDVFLVSKYFSQKKILIIDSDIIFYKKPKDILTFLKSTSKKIKIIYIKDYQNSYLANIKKIKEIFGIKINQKVNSGLIAFDKKILSSSFIITYFKTINNIKTDINNEFQEQTAFGLLASIHNSQSLPNHYYLDIHETPTKCICRHYVRPTRYFYKKDLLKRKNIL